MAATVNKQLVEQICNAQLDKRHQNWFHRLSEADRQLTEAVLKQVVEKKLSAGAVSRELKRHIDCTVSSATIARWMRSHGKD